MFAEVSAGDEWEPKWRSRREMIVRTAFIGYLVSCDLSGSYLLYYWLYYLVCTQNYDVTVCSVFEPAVLLLFCEYSRDVRVSNVDLK